VAREEKGKRNETVVVLFRLPSMRVNYSIPHLPLCPISVEVHFFRHQKSNENFFTVFVYASFFYGFVLLKERSGAELREPKTKTAKLDFISEKKRPWIE
jgi:hypothetical protein